MNALLEFQEFQPVFFIQIIISRKTNKQVGFVMYNYF